MSDSNWELVRFGDVLDSGTRNGIYKKKEFHGSGVKIVNMGELFGNPRLFSVPMKRVELSETELAKSHLLVGDLLFARRSLVAEGAGKCSVVCEITEATTFESSIIRARPDPNIADSMYLFYLFDSVIGKHLLRTIRRQTSVSGITGTDLVELQIPLPPLEEQREIANILGTLDDKIEANRRENETLEAMARAIFKSWFVDFDPVHARARGEMPYGMDAETAELFPDGFEDSELGMIPRGWEVEPVGNHVKASKGLSYKGKHLEESLDDGLPMHNLNSIEEWGGYKYKGIKFYSGDYKDRHEVQADDLIVANTEQGFKLLLIASPAIIPKFYGAKGIISHHIYKIVPKPHSHVTRLYLYYLIMLPPFRQILQGYTNGTTVNMLPSDAFVLPEFLLPPADIISKFEEIIQPMLDTIEYNHKENQTLAETRDALLPRLISGELRVGEV